jgi:hypothetical protein
MTPDIISKLYLKAFKIKFFWIDDVYVGILGKYINVKFEIIAQKQAQNRNKNKNSSYSCSCSCSVPVSV